MKLKKKKIKFVINFIEKFSIQKMFVQTNFNNVKLWSFQVPSVVTCASKLAATSFTVPMPLNQPTKKSLCGSPMKKTSFHGPQPTKIGFTNKFHINKFNFNIHTNRFLWALRVTNSKKKSHSFLENLIFSRRNSVLISIVLFSI